MKQEGLKFFPHVDLTVVAFLLFFTCFIGIVLWATSKRNKKFFDKMAELPLREDK